MGSGEREYCSLKVSSKGENIEVSTSKTKNKY